MNPNYHNPEDLIFIQSRAEIDLDLVEEYAKMMADGVGFDPVSAVSDGSTIYVYDGYHRGEAAKKVGQLLFVQTRPGNREEAEWLALGANQRHGLRRSNADKQKIVKLALMHPNGAKLSNVQIASHCGVSEFLVRKTREELESTSILSKSTERTGSDGRTINTANIGNNQPDYIAIWQLESGVRGWLEKDYPESLNARIAALEAIKTKTKDGPILLESLFIDGMLPGPRRRSDVVQACNNVLNHLKDDQWKAQRAEYIKTLICPCGQQAIEPIGTMDAIRCTACGSEWNTIHSYEVAKEEQNQNKKVLTLEDAIIFSSFEVKPKSQPEPESEPQPFNYKRDNRRSVAADIYVPQGMDACQTPAYAIDPLLPYLPREWAIWEPACGEGLLVEALYDSGFYQNQVIASDLLTNQNFFEYEPDEWDCLITNPPFSLKFQWLERCYKLGKPFALLLPVEILGTKTAQELMEHYGFGQLLLDRRINFKMPNKGWDSSAQFPVFWLCWQLFPEQVVFGKITDEK